MLICPGLLLNISNISDKNRIKKPSKDFSVLMPLTVLLSTGGSIESWRLAQQTRSKVLLLGRIHGLELAKLLLLGLSSLLLLRKASKLLLLRRGSKGSHLHSSQTSELLLRWLLCWQ